MLDASATLRSSGESTNILCRRFEQRSVFRNRQLGCFDGGAGRRQVFLARDCQRFIHRHRGMRQHHVYFIHRRFAIRDLDHRSYDTVVRRFDA